MTEEPCKQTPEWYRWSVLAVFSMIGVILSINQFMPAFFAESLMSDFGVDATGFALVTSIPTLAGILIAPVGGFLADRFGIKRVMAAGLVLSTAGAVWRCLCADFASLLVATMLLGVAASFLMALIAKLCSQWFSPAQLGLAVGIASCSSPFGIALAQAFTGVVFPSYSSAFFVGGILVVVIFALWLLVARDKPGAGTGTGTGAAEVAAREQSVFGGIRQVVGNWRLWATGMGTFLFTGANITINTFLIAGLVAVHGVDPVMAGLLASAFAVAAAAGSVVVPAFVTRTRAAKAISIALAFAGAALLYAGWAADATIARFVLFAASGLTFGGTMPIFLMFPAVLPGIEPRSVGSAGGFASMLMMVGSFVVPSFVIAPISGGDYDAIIVLSCVCIALMAVPFALLPFGSSGLRRQAE